jgi:basic membrane protein A and related proteins
LRNKLIHFLAIALFSLTACSQSPDCFQKDVFCAALVTDTRGLNDLGSNQNTWAGLEQSHADGAVDQAAYIESVNAKDYEKNIAFFVDSGYDVIVTSGIGLRNATLHNANLYPDSIFIGINQPDDESRSNFIPVTFPEDQMGFVAGVLAVRLTRAKAVGAVCETSGIDSMWRYCEGFRAGAKYADDSVKVIVVYREGESSSKLFIDDAWGYENAQKLIVSGVDVIFAAGGGTAEGALRAAGEAKVKSIGVERDQAVALGGEGSGVVASILGRTSFTVQELMRSLRDGNLPDAKMGPIEYIASGSVIPKSFIPEMDNLLADLASGEIMTNVSVEKP